MKKDVSILVVEDNEANRLLLRDILKFNGYHVIEATDGREGVAMAKADPPDLILMDMHMPVLNGFAAIRELRQDPATRDISIIAVTSFAMKGDRERILEAGADAYVTKPIDTRDLPEIIKTFLETKTGKG